MLDRGVFRTGGEVHAGDLNDRKALAKVETREDVEAAVHKLLSR